MKNKKVAVAVLATSMVLLGSVPAMASGLNIVSGNSLATGGSVVHITPSMYRSYQPPTTTTVQTPPAPPTTPPNVTVVGSSVVSLKGISNNYIGTGTVTVQQPPTPIVNTPVPTTPTTTITADEQQMVDMINADRVRNGLPALKVDLRLVSAARTKSQDLITNNYFSHVSPVFGLTASLLPALGLNTQYVSENIAGNQSVAAAEAALEADIPHQQNILDPNINYVGVGIAYGGPYGAMYTQEFARE